MSKLLYRGDSVKVDYFEIEKSNKIGLLFGKGIYLTDNIDVANDYTLDGGNAFSKDNLHQKDALAVYSFIDFDLLQFGSKNLLLTERIISM